MRITACYWPNEIILMKTVLDFLLWYLKDVHINDKINSSLCKLQIYKHTPLSTWKNYEWTKKLVNTTVNATFFVQFFINTKSLIIMIFCSAWRTMRVSWLSLLHLVTAKLCPKFFRALDSDWAKLRQSVGRRKVVVNVVSRLYSLIRWLF